MTTAEHLALAVLKGDTNAAIALADCVKETAGDVVLNPIKKLTADLGRVRVILYAGDDYEYDAEETEAVVKAWLGGTNLVLALRNVSRIELYELPETETETPRTPPATPYPDRDFGLNYTG